MIQPVIQLRLFNENDVAEQSGDEGKQEEGQRQDKDQDNHRNATDGVGSRQQRQARGKTEEDTKEPDENLPVDVSIAQGAENQITFFGIHD
ncbi:MAG: hypothetical protein WBN89_15605 [Prochlorococcaceae cyanobacterium]